MTVITVVAIAAVGALFTFFVWPNIQASLMLNTACSNVGPKGNYDNGATEQQNDSDDGTVKCVSFTCTATYQGKSFTRNCRDNM